MLCAFPHIYEVGIRQGPNGGDQQGKACPLSQVYNHTYASRGGQNYYQVLLNKAKRFIHLIVCKLFVNICS